MYRAPDGTKREVVGVYPPNWVSVVPDSEAASCPCRCHRPARLAGRWAADTRDAEVSEVVDDLAAVIPLERAVTP
jgi:hypothetical protein